MSLFEFEIPVDKIAADQFDRRMAQGWFRSGPALYRCNMLCLNNAVWGLVQIRLPLCHWVRSRNQRRVLNKNRQRFRCEFGPAQIDQQREQLYEAMKPRFQGAISTELFPLVFGASDDIFDTRECRVYDGEQLIAVSYFDVGRQSIVSQIGLYDPTYGRFSLGLYTMLEEIEYGHQCGASYFYPGYIIPGLAAFEYKLQLGDVEYLAANQDWCPLLSPPGPVPGACYIMLRVQHLEQALNAAGINFERWSYPGFWISRISSRGAGYLRALLYAKCSTVDAQGCFHVIEYLHDEDCYLLSRVRPDTEINITADCEALPENYQPFALLYENIVSRATTAAAVVKIFNTL